MNLFSSVSRTRTKSGLSPEWICALPRKLVVPPTPLPRCAVAGGTVVAWGEGLAVGIRVEDGAIAWKRKLGSWAVAGFDAGARIVLARGRASGWLDPDSGEIREERADPDPVRIARDAPDQPEEDPTLRAGDRLFRLLSETRSRVTRHWLEVNDPGLAPRRAEVASFTLRSNRLVLADRGGGRLYGWVGMDPECPAGAVVAAPSGPILILRRRYPAWHEHAAGETDLIGHGPAHLNVAIVPADGSEPRGRDLGTAPETWEGLGWRGGPPPFVERALGARPIGLAAGRILVELVELGDGKAASDVGLEPHQRFVAAFPSADLC